MSIQLRTGLAAMMLLLNAPLMACHVVPEQQLTESQPPTVAAIVRQPNIFVGRSVTLAATFSGWKGSCRGPVPVTRSDWMIEDGGACLYVSGPTPGGFSATPPERGIGERVSLQGIVESTQDGRPFIRILP